MQDNLKSLSNAWYKSEVVINSILWVIKKKKSLKAYLCVLSEVLIILACRNGDMVAMEDTWLQKMITELRMECFYWINVVIPVLILGLGCWTAAAQNDYSGNFPEYSKTKRSSLIKIYMYAVCPSVCWATSWENLLMPYVNNKGADQPAHPRSLISTFVFRWLDSKTPLLAKA